MVFYDNAATVEIINMECSEIPITKFYLDMHSKQLHFVSYFNSWS